MQGFLQLFVILQSKPRDSAAPQPLGFAACYHRDARIQASLIAFLRPFGSKRPEVERGLHEPCSVKHDKEINESI
jgi:hypothetical protein